MQPLELPADGRGMLERFPYLFVLVKGAGASPLPLTLQEASGLDWPLLEPECWIGWTQSDAAGITLVKK